MSNPIIGSNVTIGQGVRFGHYVVIRDNVTIGDGAYIGDYCIIGEHTAEYHANPTNYKAADTVIGRNTILRSHSVVYSGAVIGHDVHTGNRATIRERSIVGHHAMIGLNTELQGDCTVGQYSRLQSNVSVGKGTMIGSYVFIYPYCVFTNDNTPPSDSTNGSTIGDFTQIATASILLPGAVVGEHSFVGAGSKVAGEFADDSFIDGSPAKLVGPLSKMPFFNAKGKRHYPWPYQYDRGMPWQGQDFDEWLAKQ